MEEIKLKKKALITGVNGQDGSYLAELLIKKNYEVHGLRRRSSSDNLERISHLKIIPGKKRNLFLHDADLTESSNLNTLINIIKPDEVYNLAAQSHVHTSFQVPEYTANVNALGVLRLLEATFNFNKKCKFYQASTSEMFGNTKKESQNEKTPFNPCSPYGLSKLYGHQIVQNYRERGFFACSGILYNHESPRRGKNFVTKKIIDAVVNIKQGKQETLFIGNIFATRDWGYAKEYVEVMWKMLQQKKPKDYVVSTGKSYSVKQFIEMVFKKFNIHIIWKINKKTGFANGYNKLTKKNIIKTDPYYFRPVELNSLKGDSKLVKSELGWKPKCDLNQLIDIMLESEVQK